MLVSPNGAQMRQGDVVLVWGASGGLGGFALQYVLNGGGYPVCVVSSPEKAQKCREAGAEWVIDRTEQGFRFWGEDGRQDPKEALRLGKAIRELTGGRDPDIVFEHPGRDTFGASVFVTRRGGKIVTCASTTGFVHEFDNRYLWMFTKTIVGSHLANYAEGWAPTSCAARGARTRSSRRRTRWPRPGGPPTTCTATRTWARSASCAWRRPPGRGCWTRRCASSTSARSRATPSSGRARAAPRARGAGSPRGRRRARSPTTRGRR